MAHRDLGSTHARRPVAPPAQKPVSPARTPFPDYIIIEAGTGFMVGGTGGSVFHFLKALRGSLRGHRLAGGVQAVRANAPRLAGRMTGLFFTFSAVDSAMYSARGKEDPWNHIVGFAGARGLYRARNGIKAAVRSAVAGAVFWGLLEVSLIVMENSIADPHYHYRNNRLPLPAACSDGDPARAAG